MDGDGWEFLIVVIALICFTGVAIASMIFN